MLFVLNMDELIIIYIILNYQIIKRVTCIISCYQITNWVVFEFFIFDQLIIHVVFEMTNNIEYLLLTRSKHNSLTRLATPIHRNDDLNFHYHSNMVTYECIYNKP